MPAAAEGGGGKLSRSLENRDRERNSHVLAPETADSCPGRSYTYSLSVPRVFITTTTLEDSTVGDPETRSPGRDTWRRPPAPRPARPHGRPGIRPAAPGGQLTARPPAPVRQPGTLTRHTAASAAAKATPAPAASRPPVRETGPGAEAQDPRGKEGDGGGTGLGGAWEGPWWRRAGRAPR